MTDLVQKIADAVWQLLTDVNNRYDRGDLREAIRAALADAGEPVGRVAELEAQLAEARAAVSEWLCDGCHTVFPETNGPSVAGCLCKCGGGILRPSSLSLRNAERELAASREREGRMRGLLEDMRYDLHQYTEGFDVIWGRVDAALAADKEKK